MSNINETAWSTLTQGPTFTRLCGHIGQYRSDIPHLPFNIGPGELCVKGIDCHVKIFGSHRDHRQPFGKAHFLYSTVVQNNQINKRFWANFTSRKMLGIESGMPKVHCLICFDFQKDQGFIKFSRRSFFPFPKDLPS